MLDNFRKIYNKTLDEFFGNPDSFDSHDYDELKRMIFNSRIARMFMYEVCRECIIDENESPQ